MLIKWSVVEVQESHIISYPELEINFIVPNYPMLVMGQWNFVKWKEIKWNTTLDGDLRWW